MLLKPSHYRQAARDSLAGAAKPGRVILVHTGAMILFSLLLVLIDHLLDQQISNTGGLSGLGTRSVLATVQSVLRILQLILLPLWQIGYTYYTLRVARGESEGIRDLTEGFRRFGPILRLWALTAGMLFLLMIASSYAASTLFMLTPWATPMMTEMETWMAEGMSYMEMAEMMMARMQDYVVPLMAIFCLCFAAGSIFLFLRYRLAELWLLDHPGQGALAALRGSRRAMRGNVKGMLRIDFSFWWFFLLELIVCALSFGDVILDALGVELTMDAFGLYLIFYCLYLWAQLMLYWWKRNEVSVTYAHAYLALCPETSETEIKV